MRPTSLRFGALLAVGVLFVHEARFRLAPVEGGVADGHGYIGALAALAGLAIALAAGQYVNLLVNRQSDDDASIRRPVRLWLLAASAVLAGYAAQELLAGALSPGHPVGFAGLAADGGWMAVPLALVAGAAVALTMRCAAVALERRSRVPRPRLRPPVSSRWGADPLFARGPLLARHLVGRAPPGALSR